jgi:hypothetical protein
MHIQLITQLVVSRSLVTFHESSWYLIGHIGLVLTGTRVVLVTIIPQYNSQLPVHKSPVQVVHTIHETEVSKIKDTTKTILQKDQDPTEYIIICSSQIMVGFYGSLTRSCGLWMCIRFVSIPIWTSISKRCSIVLLSISVVVQSLKRACLHQT